MRRRIIQRYLWTSFLLLAIVLLGVDLYVPNLVYRAQTQALQHQLSTEAAILASEFPTSGTAEWVSNAAKKSGARVAIVDRDGIEIADSGSISEDSAYASAPLPNQATLRLGESLAPIRQAAAELGYRLAAITVVVLVTVALAGFQFSQSVSQRVAGLRSYTERLLDPAVADEELPGEDTEFGPLAQSLRRMAPRIRELLESLKLESGRREAILASMVEGVLAVDNDLRVILCNHSFARTVGARVPVKPGTALLELVRNPELLEIMNSVLASGQRIERKLKISTREERIFEILAGPLAGASTRGVLAILHDITELERLERVRKDFVANVSHELRTPLAAIHGYAETLLEGALEDRNHNRKFVEVILAQSSRLTNIASDLLTISTLESSEAMSSQTISVSAALESAVRTVESSAEVRGVALICEKATDFRVTGNQLRLEQIFVNLLDNAVKFNRPNGEVRIETWIENEKAYVSIADTGIGIPSEDLPRIFERFYRVDKARSREMGGTGLGLSIVKHAVEQLGGSVTVDSQLGQGSKFTLSIPIADS